MHPGEGRANTDAAHSHPHKGQAVFHRALLLLLIDLMKEVDGTTNGVTGTDSITKDKEIVPALDTQPVTSTPMYRAMEIPPIVPGMIVPEMGVSTAAIGVIIAGSRRGGEVEVPISGTRVDDGAYGLNIMPGHYAYALDDVLLHDPSRSWSFYAAKIILEISRKILKIK